MMRRGRSFVELEGPSSFAKRGKGPGAVLVSIHYDAVSNHAMQEAQETFLGGSGQSPVWTTADSTAKLVAATTGEADQGVIRRPLEDFIAIRRFPVSSAEWRLRGIPAESARRCYRKLQGKRNRGQRARSSFLILGKSANWAISGIPPSRTVCAHCQRPRPKYQSRVKRGIAVHEKTKTEEKEVVWTRPMDHGVTRCGSAIPVSHATGSDRGGPVVVEYFGTNRVWLSAPPFEWEARETEENAGPTLSLVTRAFELMVVR